MVGNKRQEILYYGHFFVFVCFLATIKKLSYYELNHKVITTNQSTSFAAYFDEPKPLNCAWTSNECESLFTYFDCLLQMKISNIICLLYEYITNIFVKKYINWKGNNSNQVFSAISRSGSFGFFQPIKLYQQNKPIR